MRRVLVVVVMCLIVAGSALQPSGAVSWEQAYSPCDWKTAAKDTKPVADDTELSGRLGSSREDFEAVYGEPVKVDPFAEYDIEGCGPVLVSFDEDSFVIDISIFSPRKSDEADATVVDPADWPIMPAFEIASSFAPLDMESDDFGTVPNPYGYVIQRCSSDALLDQVPESSWDYSDGTPDYGSFEIVLRNNPENGFFWVQVSLRVEEEAFPTA